MISKIVTGVWNWGAHTPQQINELIQRSIDAGITTFDHADIYGGYTIEKLFGDALSLTPSLKDKLQIVTKCGIKLVHPNRPNHAIKSYDTSKQHIVTSVETSLKNLQVDTLDYLLIHRPDPLMNIDEVSETIEGLKKEGKIKEFGVSNFLPHQVEMLKSRVDIKINQIEISPLKTDALYDGSLDQCQQCGITPMAWSPLGNGKIFTGQDEKTLHLKNTLAQVGEKYNLALDQTIFAWHLTHPAGITPVLGTTKAERIETAAKVMSIKLENEDWFRILEAAEGNEVP
ncbi:aldo/keto reductase [Flammeovirga yaeyamensis]|uniref:Aldo/keto reductase n=2 Tax=Flammeovirga yaeyamensis TaxID=367791 RepID=A0AAX1N7S5_9BACT|nr:aldo/keto reductase [Flammeovirga yaeyamensis]MBB3701090.1 putative oxidoreductase [Flammeovirga yaeyamensis]QWG01853.1 aldo/keto reductase [Flammeovirga yaeyamensis]